MIDLGFQVTDYDKMGGPPMAAPDSSSKDKETPKKTVYPEFSIREAPDELGEIPEDGEAVIKFHVTSKESREVAKDGSKKKELRLELEVRGITIKGMKAKGNDVKTMGDADGAVSDFFKEKPENGEQPEE